MDRPMVADPVAGGTLLPSSHAILPLVIGGAIL
jgi:hypothetical protein